jgi:beta-glucosidase
MTPSYSIAHSLKRSALNGRAPESFSEDPLLAGRVTAAMVRGAESKGVLATLKHLVCYEQCTDQFLSSSDVSMRALREIYLRPFQIALKESNARLLMTSLVSYCITWLTVQISTTQWTAYVGGQGPTG